MFNLICVRTSRVDVAAFLLLNPSKETCSHRHLGGVVHLPAILFVTQDAIEMLKKRRKNNDKLRRTRVGMLISDSPS